MIKLYIKFQVPNSNGSLVTAMIPKAKYRFHPAAILSYITKLPEQNSHNF
jgi:hypothetical protein